MSVKLKTTNPFVAALHRCLAHVEQYAETYDNDKIGLGAYEACSRVRKTVRSVLKRYQRDEWLKLADAPFNVLGFVWSPDKEFGNRTDITGTLYRGTKGSIIVGSNARGFNFTHWHPLVKPPSKSVR